jgi:hypothetical protein
MTRLYKQDKWEEVYNLGLAHLDSWLTEDSATRSLLSLFCHVAYYRDKGLLLPQPPQPQVQHLITYLQDQHTAQSELNLLLLNPMGTLPKEYDTTDPFLTLEISYLSGDFQAHQVALSKISQWPADNIINLLLIGDYDTALIVVNKASNDTAFALSQKIRAAKAQADEKFQALKALSRRVPKAYWEKTAEETLQTMPADWEVHAYIAEGLVSRDDYKAALIQEKLAARYATSEQEKEKWLKKAKKTQEKLNRL